MLGVRAVCRIRFRWCTLGMSALLLLKDKSRRILWTVHACFKVLLTSTRVAMTARIDGIFVAGEESCVAACNQTLQSFVSPFRKVTFVSLSIGRNQAKTFSLGTVYELDGIYPAAKRGRILKFESLRRTHFRAWLKIRCRGGMQGKG